MNVNVQEFTLGIPFPAGYIHDDEEGWLNDKVLAIPGVASVDINNDVRMVRVRVVQHSTLSAVGVVMADFAAQVVRLIQDENAGFVSERKRFR